MNSEGYSDPTADKAIKNVRKKESGKEPTPPEVMKLVNMIRSIASLAGFEVIGRVALRDRYTGKEYR